MNWDFGELRTQLGAQPELWNRNPERKGPDSPFRDVDDIWVRYNDISRLDDLSKANDPHIPVWYPAWKALPALRPFVFALMAEVEGEMLGGILLNRVPPGNSIHRHRDASWHVDYYEKFFCIVQHPKGALFGYDNDGVDTEGVPAADTVYVFDNRRDHWVFNPSGEGRISLIVCIRTDRYGRY